MIFVTCFMHVCLTIKYYKIMGGDKIVLLDGAGANGGGAATNGLLSMIPGMFANLIGGNKMERRSRIKRHGAMSNMSLQCTIRMVFRRSSNVRTSW